MVAEEKPRKKRKREPKEVQVEFTVPCSVSPLEVAEAIAHGEAMAKSFLSGLSSLQYCINSTGEVECDKVSAKVFATIVAETVRARKDEILPPTAIILALALEMAAMAVKRTE